jgi:hypothetical protein
MVVEKLSFKNFNTRLISGIFDSLLFLRKALLKTITGLLLVKSFRQRCLLAAISMPFIFAIADIFAIELGADVVVSSRLRKHFLDCEIPEVEIKDRKTHQKNPFLNKFLNLAVLTLNIGYLNPL